MARELSERSGKPRRSATTEDSLKNNPHRQRLVRDIALIMLAPFLLYLLVSLFTFSAPRR
ncbi:MAG: hypothetical protein E6Q88_04790 [Lysobacteraceae bacterium]|nr:MAG: hypothetical protein E6Q88_04790 [Xanthomonadaceae bacterium]